MSVHPFPISFMFRNQSILCDQRMIHTQELDILPRHWYLAQVSSFFSTNICVYLPLPSHLEENLKVVTCYYTDLKYIWMTEWSWMFFSNIRIYAKNEKLQIIKLPSVLFIFIIVSVSYWCLTSHSIAKGYIIVLFF